MHNRRSFPKRAAAAGITASTGLSSIACAASSPQSATMCDPKTFETEALNVRRIYAETIG